MLLNVVEYLISVLVQFNARFWMEGRCCRFQHWFVSQTTGIIISIPGETLKILEDIGQCLY